MKSKIFLYDELIGERLRFFRKKRGLTQAALANILSISPQQLQKYEIGKNRISASRIKQVAEVLDVPVNYLMNHPTENIQRSSDSTEDSSTGRLVYYYSMIKSEKIKKLLVTSSAIYVENGL